MIVFHRQIFKTPVVWFRVTTEALLSWKLIRSMTYSILSNLLAVFCRPMPHLHFAGDFVNQMLDRGSLLTMILKIFARSLATLAL